MNRVLVTGAAGRLGRVVLRTLHEHGIAATALVLPAVGTVDTADSMAAVDVIDTADTVDTVAALGADRVVVGDARDPAAVATALRDVDAVIHLAAIPSPELGTPEEVFGGNTVATFTVLHQAARAGVRRAAIASSYSVTGLPFAAQTRQPAYLPIDEALPLQVADPYALSKQVDELTAAMMWPTYGLSVVALRFPFLGDPADTLPRRARQFAEDPALGRRELWGYLDLRDAADVCLAALRVTGDGCHVVSLAAPQTLSAWPTEELLARFLPDVPRRRAFPGRMAPFDLRVARELLNFAPKHLYAVAAL